MFLSVSFSGAASLWEIVETEEFALVQSVKRADYLEQHEVGVIGE
jgi:hypothetical protein